MAYASGDLDATLAAASGDDPQLLAELRQAFVESLARQIDLLSRARCDGNWQVAAMRIRSLAASFRADPLILLAEEAIETVPGDPVIVRKLRNLLDDFAAG